MYQTISNQQLLSCNCTHCANIVQKYMCNLGGTELTKHTVVWTARKRGTERKMKKGREGSNKRGKGLKHQGEHKKCRKKKVRDRKTDLKSEKARD